MASWTKAKNLSAFDSRALDHYRAAFADPLRIHAHCEDYRAGRYADLAQDEADRAAGRTIACPLFGLVGRCRHRGGDRGASEDLEQWAPQATGKPIDFRPFPHRGKSGSDRGGVGRLLRRLTQEIDECIPCCGFTRTCSRAPKRSSSGYRRCRVLSLSCTAPPRSAKESVHLGRSLAGRGSGQNQVRRNRGHVLALELARGDQG